MRHIRCRSAVLAGLFAILIIPLLAGCRAEEQNRITMYEPGVYMGKKQAVLGDDQVRALRYRVRGQSGSTKPTGGGTNVLGKELDARLLGQRTGIQGDS